MVRIGRSTVIVFTMIYFIGCGSGEETTNLPAEERFQLAKQLFDEQAYLEAINQFTIITLQYQGSAYAGDAQFYLGECRFNRGEYLLAAFEYQQLKRNMSASPRVPEAQYKLGLSYYNLSPKSTLDQEYTLKAKEELQTFVEYYPGHELAADAEAKIAELIQRLAKKEYDTARYYATWENYKAAIFYYHEVIEKYHDTEYAPLSYLGKVEALIARKKYQEAYNEINKFIELHPNSVLRSQADKLKESIENELQSNPPVSGKESGRTLGVGNEPGVSSKIGPGH
ncbi:MAG: outer membrane protein assembly factor BamD [Ignavibacteriae bacterium]|nr:outer membrane protein assembly factor BamD [Ignavibacteriota bacterium]